MTEKSALKRVTKRKHAAELYPHPDEDEVRPLEVEVPTLYAESIGWNVQGTGWSDAFPGGYGEGTVEHTVAAQLTVYRILLMVAARQRALLADALLQGMSGQEAWEWVELRAADETGECMWDEAKKYGIDYDAIEPYPCGPEPDQHDHHDEPNAHGWRRVHRIAGRESECPDCTVLVEVAGAVNYGGRDT